MYSALIPRTFRLRLVHSRWGNPAHSHPVQLEWVIGNVRAAMHTMEFNPQSPLHRGPRRKEVQPLYNHWLFLLPLRLSDCLDTELWLTELWLTELWLWTI